MPKWLNHSQGSDAWLKSRIGILTASRMADAMATTKNGESEKRRGLKYDIAFERMSGQAVTTFVNEAMKWGIKYEPEARDAYESITGNIVQTCGLAMHDEIPHLGASPDGLVGDDGLIEIKCPQGRTFVDYLLADVVLEQYKPQMCLQLIVTGRQWCDFVAYHPSISRPYPNIFIKRFTPSDEDLAKVKMAAMAFLAEVELLTSNILKKGE